MRIHYISDWFDNHHSVKKFVKIIVLGMVAQGINLALANFNLLELDPNYVVLLTALLTALENYINHMDIKKK